MPDPAVCFPNHPFIIKSCIAIFAALPAHIPSFDPTLFSNPCFYFSLLFLLYRMSRVHTCPIELSEFAGATFKAAIQLPGTLPSKATIATTTPLPPYAHARRASEISSSSCRSIEEVDNDSLARDLFQVAFVAPDEADFSGFENESNSETPDSATAAAATVEFDRLRVTEPTNSALPPIPTKLKLRLPAAAVHRRVRSLEAVQPRPSS